MLAHLSTYLAQKGQPWPQITFLGIKSGKGGWPWHVFGNSPSSREYWLLLKGVGSPKEAPGGHWAAEFKAPPPLTGGTSVGVWVPVILLRCSLDHDLILLSILDSEDGGGR